MPRRAARFTQSEVVRVLRAAKQGGARWVKIDPDGTMWIDPNHAEQNEPPQEQVATEREIIL